MGRQRRPDFKVDSHPNEHMGPFIMNAEGVGRLFAPLALFADGPFPEHYERSRARSPTPSIPAVEQPVVKKLKTPADKYATTGGEFNVILHHLPVDRALPLLTRTTR